MDTVFDLEEQEPISDMLRHLTGDHEVQGNGNVAAIQGSAHDASEDDTDMDSLASDDSLIDTLRNLTEDAPEAEGNGTVAATQGSTHNQDSQLDINANENAANALVCTFERNDDNEKAQEGFSVKHKSSPHFYTMPGAAASEYDNEDAQDELTDAAQLSRKPAATPGMDFHPIQGAAASKRKAPKSSRSVKKAAKAHRPNPKAIKSTAMGKTTAWVDSYTKARSSVAAVDLPELGQQQAAGAAVVPQGRTENALAAQANDDEMDLAARFRAHATKLIAQAAAIEARAEKKQKPAPGVEMGKSDAASCLEETSTDQEAMAELEEQQAAAVAAGRIGPLDVLTGGKSNGGRGRNAHHEHYMTLVREQVAAYAEAQRAEDDFLKRSIADRVANAVHSRKGRFLRHHENGEWHIMSLEDSIEKVMRSIRDAIRARNRRDL
jgi:hypothetical protein